MSGKKTDKKLTPWTPTAKFKAWADLYLDPDEPRGMYKACEGAGVAPPTIYDHLKKPEALEYLNSRRLEVMRVHAPRIDGALVKKAKAGDVQAMRLFYERFDELKIKTETEVTLNGPLVIERNGQRKNG